MIVTIPMRIPSCANLREHWRAKATRVKRQRSAVALLFGTAWRHAGLSGDVYSVVMTRLSPRMLDDDNLASAFKAVRDQIAAEIGMDDRDPRYRWVCDQRKSKDHAIEIFVSVFAPVSKQESLA